MKLKLHRGTTSKIVRIYLQNATSSTGAGLTGVTYQTSGLKWSYIREGDSAVTVVVPVTATVGAWTSKGFKQIDQANMQGWYELGIPDHALALGGTVAMTIFGVPGAVTVNIEIELDSVDYQDATAMGIGGFATIATAIANKAVTPVTDLSLVAKTTDVTGARDTITTAISNKAVTPATDLSLVAKTTDVTGAKDTVVAAITAKAVTPATDLSLVAKTTDVTGARDTITTAISNKVVTPATDLSLVAKTTDVTGAKDTVVAAITAKAVTPATDLSLVAKTTDVTGARDTILNAVDETLKAVDYLPPANDMLTTQLVEVNTGTQGVKDVSDDILLKVNKLPPADYTPYSDIIHDTGGLPLVGANVYLTKTSEASEAPISNDVTGAAGDFTVYAPVAGNYYLRVEAPGWQRRMIPVRID